MSLLNSKFDIVNVEHTIALASLAQVLPVTDVTWNANGTPIAGTIPPGAVVMMDTTGSAVLAQSPDISAANRKLIFITVDGNMDYSGSFVQKITVLHGGLTIETDQYTTGAYTPGLPVTFGLSGPNAGKIELMTDRATQQLLGFVGPAGLDSTRGVLQVIIPQGAGL
jgi:hypothetical protein